MYENINFLYERFWQNMNHSQQRNKGKWHKTTWNCVQALQIDSECWVLTTRLMINWSDSETSLLISTSAWCTVWISGAKKKCMFQGKLFSKCVGVLCHLNAVKKTVTKSSHNWCTSLLFMCQLKSPTADQYIISLWPFPACHHLALSLSHISCPEQ